MLTRLGFSFGFNLAIFIAATLYSMSILAQGAGTAVTSERHKTEQDVHDQKVGHQKVTLPPPLISLPGYLSSPRPQMNEGSLIFGLGFSSGVPADVAGLLQSVEGITSNPTDSVLCRTPIGISIISSISSDQETSIRTNFGSIVGLLETAAGGKFTPEIVRLTSNIDGAIASIAETASTSDDLSYAMLMSMNAAGLEAAGLMTQKADGAMTYNLQVDAEGYVSIDGTKVVAGDLLNFIWQTKTRPQLVIATTEADTTKFEKLCATRLGLCTRPGCGVKKAA